MRVPAKVFDEEAGEGLVTISNRGKTSKPFSKLKAVAKGKKPEADVDGTAEGQVTELPLEDASVNTLMSILQSKLANTGSFDSRQRELATSLYGELDKKLNHLGAEAVEVTEVAQAA